VDNEDGRRIARQWKREIRQREVAADHGKDDRFVRFIVWTVLWLIWLVGLAVFVSWLGERR
jgi:hypothetical protein